MFWLTFYDWWLNSCCYDFNVGQTEVTDDILEDMNTKHGCFILYFSEYSLATAQEVR